MHEFSFLFINISMTYDARARRFFFVLARVLDLTPMDVTAVERSVAQQMYFALQESSDVDKDPNLEDRAQLMQASSQKAMEASNKKKTTMRWIATGAGVIGGGALIALTGGLAAPMLAPLLAGMYLLAGRHRLSSSVVLFSFFF